MSDVFDKVTETQQITADTMYDPFIKDVMNQIEEQKDEPIIMFQMYVTASSKNYYNFAREAALKHVIDGFKDIATVTAFTRTSRSHYNALTNYSTECTTLYICHNISDNYDLRTDPLKILSESKPIYVLRFNSQDHFSRLTRTKNGRTTIHGEVFESLFRSSIRKKDKKT